MIPEKLLDITKCNINYYKLKQKAVISSGNQYKLLRSA